MNRIHRTIWSTRLNARVAVSEITRSVGKPRAQAGALLASVLLGAAGPVAAQVLPTGSLPTGARVSAGQATITTQGQAMTVTQGTQRAAIDWQGFSIGRDASVQFVQPNAGAVALNRVVGNEASVIDGALRSNGQVWLLNPNGVLFNRSARVDVGGLVASTRTVGDADFLSGASALTLEGGAGADVRNLGRITAADGGYVALVGRAVRNDGTITARLGRVVGAAGDRVTLNFNGDSLVGVAVDRGALEALVANAGAIQADGGEIVLTARAASSLVDAVVNNTGEVRARTIAEREGRILLVGDLQHGRAEIAGRLDASAPDGGHGGFVDTSAADVRVQPGTVVTTAARDGRAGTWLIDPTDFAITSGTAAQTTAGIGAGTLESALAAGNVTIQTQAAGTGDGHILVNAPVGWSANQLSLQAHGDIRLNAVLTASGTSTLDLKTGYNFDSSAPTYDFTKGLRAQWTTASDGTPGFLGRVDFLTTPGGAARTGAGHLSINGAAYTLIAGLGSSTDHLSAGNLTLQGLGHASQADGNFAIAASVDASATSGWNAGAGFNPIANRLRLDGLGHTVSGLTINRPSLSRVGLFGGGGFVAVNDLSNLGLTDVTITGGALVGALLADGVDLDSAARVRLSNLFATGTVTSTVGGGGNAVGGVIGRLRAERGQMVLQDVAFRGTVSTTASGVEVGGIGGSVYDRRFDGSSWGGTLDARNLQATGTVSAPSGRNVGGVIGYASEITLDSARFAGTVSGNPSPGLGSGASTGGVVGIADWMTTLSRLESVGTAVSGGVNVGGVLGYAWRPMMSELVATGGTVTGLTDVGGLIGRFENGTLARSFSTNQVNGRTGATGGFGGAVGRSFRSFGELAPSLSDVYARGNVTAAGASNVGGLIGSASATTVSRTYSTGTVSGNAGVGGLVGLAATSTVNASYWDVQTSGIGTAGAGTGSAGGTGQTTADMTTRAFYENAGWNFTFLTGTWLQRGDLNNAYPVLRTGPVRDQLTVSLPSASRAYGDANPSLAAATVTGCPSGCGAYVTGIDWGTAVGPTAGVGSYAFTAPGVLDFRYGSGAGPNSFDVQILGSGLTIAPRLVSIDAASGATRVYDGTSLVGATLFTLGNLVNGDTVTLTGQYRLDAADAGIRSVASAMGGSSAPALSNANYALPSGLPGGSLLVTPRPLTVATVGGASRVYDATTTAAPSLFAVSGLLPGDQASLTGAATLSSAEVGARSVSLGTLASGNANYTLASAAPTGTVQITPRPLNLSFVVADKTFDGGVGATATSQDDRIAGDVFTVDLTAAFGDAVPGVSKPVSIGGLTLTGPAAANYAIAGGTGVGVTGNVTRRSVSYSLAASDPARQWMANGQPLLTPSQIDALVSVAWTNTVGAVAPGALAYTIWQNGTQVGEVRDVGTYEVRAGFASTDPHYVIGANGNQTLSLTVQVAAAPVGQPGTDPVGQQPATDLTAVVQQAVRLAAPSLPPQAARDPAAGTMRAATPPNVALVPTELARVFGDAASLRLLGAPAESEDSQAVPLSQARRLLQGGSPAPAASGRGDDVRVPIGRNALAELVNGGVKLPTGVDQLLFVVSDKAPPAGSGGTLPTR